MDIGMPKVDIGLVCNRSHFGNGRHSISHFTATKGAGSSWKCVGAEHDITEFVSYSRLPFYYFESIYFGEKQKNDLCCDVKDICKSRDKIIDHMKDLYITIGDFQ